MGGKTFIEKLFLLPGGSDMIFGGFSLLQKPPSYLFPCCSGGAPDPLEKLVIALVAAGIGEEGTFPSVNFLLLAFLRIQAIVCIFPQSIVQFEQRTIGLPNQVHYYCSRLVLSLSISSLCSLYSKPL